MLTRSTSEETNVLPAYFANAVVCPICKSDLVQSAETVACQNTSCGATFRFVGQSIVLADETTAPVSFDAKWNDLNKSKAKSYANRYLPTLDFNVVPDSTKEFLTQEILKLAKRPVVVNIGGKHPTSITGDICARDDIDDIECDLAYRPRTRLLANPEQLPFADNSADAVLMDAILEHVANPQDVVAEAWRVLKPNGIVYSDTPFMVQVHGGAFDYTRFSKQGHRWMFRNFKELKAGASSGPGAALAFAFQSFLLSFTASTKARYAAKTFARLTVFWLKYFDRHLAQKPQALDAAQGLYFMGRKSETALSERELIESYDGRVPHLFPPA